MITSHPHASRSLTRYLRFPRNVLACLLFQVGGAWAADSLEVTIGSAEYNSERGELNVAVSLARKSRQTVELFNEETGSLLDSKTTRGTEVRFRVRRLFGDAVPCIVRAESAGQFDVRSVDGVPAGCGDPPPPPTGNSPPDCRIVAPAEAVSINVGQTVFFEGEGSDPDGDELAWSWDFGGGSDSPRPDVAVPGDVVFDHEGAYNVVMTVADGAGGSCSDQVSVSVGAPPQELPEKVAEQPAPGTSGAGDGDHVVLAFNDLGMHCADLGAYPFSILPLFNVVNAQVVRRGRVPELLEAGDGVTLRYSAASNPNDPVGPDSINSTSQNFPAGAPADAATVRKSDFWDDFDGQSIVAWLFGADLPPDVGLHGLAMPGVSDPYYRNDPQDFSGYVDEHRWFRASGIPITSVDDQGRINAYPLMRVQAVDAASGAIIATTDAVVPVSTEVDCRDCHALGEVGADPDAWPGVGFMAPASPDRVDVEAAAKHNILVLHDVKHDTTFVADQAPVLCANCHRSNALAEVGGPSGWAELTSMSAAMHGFHGRLQLDDIGQLMRHMDGYPVLIDPASMDGSERQLIPSGPGVTMEESCFSCHPGKITQCFRGAMFTAGQKCDDCHGGMLATGGAFDLATTGAPREPWVDEPKCSSCHSGHGDQAVGNLAYDPNDPAATPFEFTASRFAENPGTLYRNSLDNHAGVACEGCHGSPHAIWPNRNPAANDNVPAVQLQGHAGTISECTVCHEPGSFPNGTLNGPHGMHPVNDPDWIKSKGDFYHEDFVWRNGEDQCAACHGSDHRGTRLSRVPVDRVLRDADGVVRATVAEGDVISCDLCHSLEKSFED